MSKKATSPAITAASLTAISKARIAEPWIGTSSVSRFELISKLGEGAFGEVWKARDKINDRIVALKILFPAKIPESINDIKREISLLREISSIDKGCIEGIPCLYEAFQCEDRICITMEFIDGPNLYDVLRKYIERDEKMSDKLLFSIMTQFLRILDYLHSRGIAHRDIKEENIILRRDGTVFLVDFGLSCLFSQSASSKHKCVGYAGTPVTVAPEVISGAIKKDIEGWEKADIWSTGITFWEIAMGQEATVIAQDIIDKTATSIPDVNHPNDVLSVAIDAMLKVDPQKRPTARELLVCLRRLYRPL